VESALAFPAGPTQIEAYSFIRINEFGTFIAKNVPIYALASGGFYVWQGPQLCLFKEDLQIL